ncbi:MAG: MBL fold metallo-hydrolase [Burkholderiales bacterium]|nr:MBL fold metallo-hydrolase [Burkholderiales bacterium]
MRSIVLAWLGLLVIVTPLRSVAADAAVPQPLVSVAPDVYVLPGHPGEVAPDNEGRVGNIGFVVGPTGVTVIDTGVSLAHGRALLAAIRRLTDRPVDAVIDTHAMQEFLFGNAAFDTPGTVFMTHARGAELMRARCEHCLQNLRQILGDATMAGTRLIVPTETVAGDTRLTSGGRAFDLLDPGWASTPGNLMVLDRTSGVLFAGGVVAVDRVPELRDADFDGWIRALEALPSLPVRTIVPGHGPVVAAARAGETLAYLRALDERVRALYHAGTGLLDTVEQADLPRFAGWAGYPALHRRNVLYRYLALEVEDLNR